MDLLIFWIVEKLSGRDGRLVVWVQVATCHYVFTTSSLRLHYVFTTSSLRLHYVFTTSSLRLHYVFTTSSADLVVDLCFGTKGSLRKNAFGAADAILPGPVPINRSHWFCQTPCVILAWPTDERMQNKGSLPEQ